MGKINEQVHSGKFSNKKTRKHQLYEILKYHQGYNNTNYER